MGWHHNSQQANTPYITMYDRGGPRSVANPDYIDPREATYVTGAGGIFGQGGTPAKWTPRQYKSLADFRADKPKGDYFTGHVDPGARERVGQTVGPTLYANHQLAADTNAWGKYGIDNGLLPHDSGITGAMKDMFTNFVLPVVTMYAAGSGFSALGGAEEGAAAGAGEAGAAGGEGGGAIGAGGEGGGAIGAGGGGGGAGAAGGVGSGAGETGGTLSQVGTWMGAHPELTAMGALAALSALNKGPQSDQPAQTTGQGWLPAIHATPVDRKYIPYEGDYHTYGQTSGSHQFFDPVSYNPKLLPGLTPQPGEATGPLSTMAQPAQKLAKGGAPASNDEGRLSPLHAIAGAHYTTQESGPLVQGPGGGQDDKIPAWLANGEYVFDASTVSDLGDGSTEVGAKKLDELRELIRKHKRGGAEGLPPKAKPTTAYLKGGL